LNKLYNYTDKNFCYEMQRLMLCKKGKECIGTGKNKEKTNGNNFEKRDKGKERENSK